MSCHGLDVKLRSVAYFGKLVRRSDNVEQGSPNVLYHNFNVGDLKENMIFYSGRRAAARKDAELGQGGQPNSQMGNNKNSGCHTKTPILFGDHTSSIVIVT